MTVWEYREEVCPPDGRVACCNRLGSEGWELVRVEWKPFSVDHPTEFSSRILWGTEGWVCLFKRPRREEGGA